MLIDIYTREEINNIPFRETFETIESRLSESQHDAIVAEINRLMDEAGGEIVTAGWLPGPDWTGTPFEPIYRIAARRNEELAGKMFGLLVWHTIMLRPERWASGRFEKDGVELSSRTYFRID